MDISYLLSAVKAWVQEQSGITGLLLVGSHARGKATSASDIDLVILTQSANGYLEDTTWVEKFGDVASKTIENWGNLSSIRVFFLNGLEVEFGVTSTDWIALPLDEGTRHVLMGGYKILYDPDGRIADTTKTLRLS